MAAALAAGAQTDLVIAIGECTLGQGLLDRAEREQMTLSVGVDLLGLGTGGLHTPRRLARAGEATLLFDWTDRVVVEPGESIWMPLVEALRSEDEQDSDTYFVLSGQGERGEEELGTAHVNLEAIYKRGRDEIRARLPVLDAQQRRVAWLTVSVEAVGALGWVASGGGDKLVVGVTVGSVVLSAAAQKQLGSAVMGRPMCVEVELPARLPAIRSPAKRPSAQGRLAFDFSGQAEIVPGSDQHMGLLDALASADASLTEIRISLVAVAEFIGGARERELGSVTLLLSDILKRGDEPSGRVVELRGASVKGEPVCTVAVSLSVLDVLRMLEQSAAAATHAEQIDAPLQDWLENGGPAPQPVQALAGKRSPGQPAADAGLPFELIDAKPGGPDAAKPRARASDRGRTDGAVGWSSLLEMAETVAGSNPSKADFAPDKWVKARVQQLWRMCTLFARAAIVLRLQAQRQRQAAALDALRQQAAQGQRAARQKRRLAEVRRVAAAEAAGAGTGSRGDAGAQQAVLELYERLLHGMDGVLRAALADAAAMRRQCEHLGLLLESRLAQGPREIAQDASRFSHALSFCSFAYGRDAVASDEEDVASDEPRFSMRAIGDLQRATDWALSRADPTSRAAALRDGPATHDGWPGGKQPFPVDADPQALASGDADPQALAPGVAGPTDPKAPLLLRAGRLRLRGVALHALRREAVQLALSITSAELRLPPLRTVLAVPTLAQLDFGFEGEWALVRRGAAWARLCDLLHRSAPGISGGTAALALRLQLLAGSAAAGMREVAAASVPLLRLLGEAGPVALLSPSGGVFAECDVSAECPSLLQAAARLRAAAPTITLAVRELALGLQLRGQAVWVETELLGVPDAPLRTPSRPASDRVRFDHQFDVPVMRGSAAEARLLDALQEEEPALRFRLMSSGPAGSSLLATGELPLTKDSASGSDLATSPLWSQTVEMRAAGGGSAPVGTLSVRLSLERAARQALHERQGRAEVRLRLGQLDLADAPRRDAGLSAVWVEVQLPPAVASCSLRSGRVHVGHSTLRPPLSATLAVSAQQLRQLGAQLHRLLQPGVQAVPTREPVRKPPADAPQGAGQAGGAAAPADAAKGKRGSVRPSRRAARPARDASGGAREEVVVDVAASSGIQPAAQIMAGRREAGDECCATFVLRGEHRRGEVELGRGRIDLCEMLRGGEEKLRVSLTLVDAYGAPAAQLQLALHAQEALRAAWWAEARREHMHVRLHDVSLTREALERASAGGALCVWARVSSAGVLPEVGTSEVTACAGRIRFNRSFEVWLAKQSEPAVRLEQALRSRDGMSFRIEVCARRAGGLASTDELRLGTASLGLREVLRAGGDLLHGALPLLDGHGGSVGEVRLSVLAREVCRALFGPRSWQAEAVGIALHALELLAPPGGSRSHTAVRVDIDFLASSVWSSQPKPLPADGSGLVRLDESWDVPLGPGDSAFAAVRAALASEEEQDSDVYFVLFGTAVGAGQGKELGTAHVNLEQMLKRGADVSRARLPVLDAQQRRVAWLTVSVEAVGALGWVASGGGDKLVVGVTVGSVVLSAAAQKQLGQAVMGRPMCVEVELPARLPAIRSPAKRPSAQGRLAFDFSGQAEIVPGSDQHMGLLDALASADASLAEATVRLLSSADAAASTLPVEIASAEVVLLSLLGEASAPVLLRAVSPHDAPIGTVEIRIRAAELAKAARNVAAARLLHAARVSVPLPASPNLPDPPATAPNVVRAAAHRPLPEGFDSGYFLEHAPVGVRPPVRSAVSYEYEYGGVGLHAPPVVAAQTVGPSQSCLGELEEL